ncbi:MAG: hypothetical protein M1831_006472 [Alyxoria varia]|nr:MAG: hypothetical protein M1831_006472 [Alyxoria varia]
MGPRGRTICVALTLALIPPALAQGTSDHGGNTTHAKTSASNTHGECNMHSAMTMDKSPSHGTPLSYWSYNEHAGIVYAHIAFMILTWVLALPLATVFSIARSRLKLPAQLAFLALNGIGMVTGFVYNHHTPDLYPDNSHHKAGWAVTFIATGWVVLSVVTSFTAKVYDDADCQYQPVSAQAMVEHHCIHGPSSPDHRWSRDSGQGTERNTASLCTSSRSNSWNSNSFNAHLHEPYRDDNHDDDHGDPEKSGFLHNTALERFFSSHVPRFVFGRTATALELVYIVIERFIIPLGFVAIATGAVAYGGIARGDKFFNILAHFVKGGIFFWYGLLTFGRWMGCFADLGWAWNVKPGANVVGTKKARRPSAEFTESFVIWLYGATNVFMEHLTAWGKAWTPMDLEHVSITIMFFGGGLLGMLIESPRIRSCLNGTLTPPLHAYAQLQREWQPPDSYVHSLNPLPGLVIMLLGMMMSSHTQHSHVSSMIHKQWGTLFVGFALARAVTYIIFWLKPPTSYMPGRPPSEIVAAFCLISGGLIFMASNADTVRALEAYELDAMFTFTVVMGFTAVLMAWQMLLLAIKNWTSRRSRPFRTTLSFEPGLSV